MTSVILEGTIDSLMTTDGAVVGCGSDQFSDHAAARLTDLAGELAHDLDVTHWAMMLQGELEDAFDTAFMWAAFAETPTLSGTDLSMCH